MKVKEGVYAISLNAGDAKIAVGSVKDIGRTAAKIFAEKKFINEYYNLAGDKVTFQEMADILSKYMKKKIIYNKLDDKTFASFPFPEAHELANMFYYFRECK